MVVMMIASSDDCGGDDEDAFDFPFGDVVVGSQ